MRRGPFLAWLALAYAALYLAMTWPAALDPWRSLPGRHGDLDVYVWNLWAQSRAVVEGRSPLSTDLLCAPGDVPVAVHAHVLLHGLLAVPLLPALGALAPADAPLGGLLAATGLLLAFSFVSTAAGTAWVALRLTGSRAGAALAGFVFAFAPIKMVHLVGHHNLVATEAMAPCLGCMLLALRACRASGGRSGGAGAPRSARRWAAWGGGWLLACLLLDYYLTFYVFVAAGVLFAVEAALRPRQIPLMLRCSVVLLGPATVGALLLYWSAAGLGAGDVAALSTQVQTGAREFVADLGAWLLPSVMHPWWGGWAEAAGASFCTGSGEWNVAPGYLVVALAAAGALLARRVRFVPHLAGVAAAGFVLSLGPHARWWGTVLPGTLPYALLNVLPFTRNVRIPARAAILAMLGLALLAAYGWRRLERRWSGGALGRAALALLLCVAVVEYWTAPFPQAPFPEPGWVRAVAGGEPGGAVLAVPLWLRDGFQGLGTYREEQQSWQAVHGRALLGGMLARLPERVWVRGRTEPFFRLVLALQGGDEPAYGEADVASCRDFLRAADVRFVAVEGAFRRPALLRFLERVLPLGPWREAGGDVVAEVAREPVSAPRPRDGPGSAGAGGAGASPSPTPGLCPR